MARTKIELSFYDKKYTIEYCKMGVKYFLEHTKDDGVAQTIALIKGGLIKHHEDNMPTDEEIFSWVMAMGEDVSEFANTLREMVEATMKSFEDDKKNLKWGKVVA